MSVFMQKLIAFWLSFITFFGGIFGVNRYEIKPYSTPENGTESVEPDKLYERYGLPVFSKGTLLGIYESSGGTTIGRYENTEEADFDDYVSALTQSGFEKYDINTIENNRFATLTKDNATVSVSRFSRTKTLRIIAEPKGALCPLTDNAQGEYDTLLTGMKGETIVAGEGMGFIIRLKDGSFCIIDGGMGDPDSVDSDKLMNILLAQKPENVEKPVIAAWIFSHLHGDHIGVFNCFSIDHHDDVVIEKLYFNFPKEEEIQESDSPYMLDDSIYRYTQFKKCLAEYYPDVQAVKLHSGNRFAVRNASCEVLYAYDDLYPLTIVEDGMNGDSLLIKMTVENQTIMWTGDIAFNATDMVLWEYDKELKSDFLQMAHHGMNGTEAFYSRIDPTYTLLPVWPGGLEQGMLNRPQNKWLVGSRNMKQMIVTSCGTWTIRLPYQAEPKAKDRIPLEGDTYPAYPTLLG